MKESGHNELLAEIQVAPAARAKEKANEEIQKEKKLKKTDTVDKSAPIIESGANF